MNATLKYAFKEWAVICRALAEGKQSLILRKGGIEENEGSFRLEHTLFWLFPTYTHQQITGIKPEARPWLENLPTGQSNEESVCLSHFARVEGVYHVHELFAALLLERFHLWSEDTVRQRFAYKTPGLFVLLVRVHQALTPFQLPNTPAYQGCRSWVELDRDLPTSGAQPVLDDGAFADLTRTVEGYLNPIALA